MTTRRQVLKTLPAANALIDQPMRAPWKLDV
jgi:hypothetical protein